MKGKQTGLQRGKNALRQRKQWRRWQERQDAPVGNRAARRAAERASHITARATPDEDDEAQPTDGSGAA